MSEHCEVIQDLEPPFGNVILNNKTTVRYVEVEYNEKRLTYEQIELAKKIIKEKQIYGFVEVMNTLSKAGFRGKIGYDSAFGLPPIVMIDYKVNKEK